MPPPLPSPSPEAPPPAMPVAAALQSDAQGTWRLSGAWTLAGLQDLPAELAAKPPEAGALVLDGGGLSGFDSVGAWVLQGSLYTPSAPGAPGAAEGRPVAWVNWPPASGLLMAAAAAHPAAPPQAQPKPNAVSGLGQRTLAAGEQGLALLAFVGDTAIAAAHVARHPARLRWRSIGHHVQVAGVEALPIVSVTAFLMGVVVAYQGADQLRHYGASIFVVDLVGYAMLREFAPLMTAILIAGRSGSSYAAQIGTMVVTDEIDAMRTLGTEPPEALVLPRLAALLLALPLLTLVADVAGVLGGMVMASAQLGIGFREFFERFGREMQGSTLLVGIGKSVVFAAVIAVVGCFQGFRTRGAADAVGRHTTQSVVQAIFLVVAADGVFSVLFNWLGI